MILRLISFLLSTTVLAGCVTFDVDNSLSRANSEFSEFTNGNLQLNRTSEQRDVSKARADSLLESTIDQDAAVELALQNSPAVQAMLANYWLQASSTALSGSIPNPVLEFG